MSTWCASFEETTSGQERSGGWCSPHYIRAAENTPPFLSAFSLSHKSKLVYRRPSSTASSARRGVQLRNFFLLPTSTNSTYLQPTKTRLRRLRKRPKACSSPAKPRTMPGSQQQTRHHWKPATLSARRRPHLWAKPATLVVDEYSTNSAIANATIMATNPTSLEAGHTCGR